jgi:hypothetical protein
VPLLPFFRVSNHRYVVYWDVLTPEQWATLKQDRVREQERRQAMEARALDQVTIGDPSSETAHGLKFERSNTGRGAYGSHMETHWRDAPDGWFSFELKVAPDRPVELLCTYWGKERGARTFDIQVNGQTIATTSLDSNHPAAFYDQAYPVPPVLTQGKARVTVKFLAHAQNVAGGLFGLRTLISR